MVKTTTIFGQRKNMPIKQFFIAATVAACVGTGALPAQAAVGDGDDDGVADAVDPFPCRADLASVQTVPAAGQYATLLYEDQWPSEGDFDFNDLVLSNSVELYRDAQGRVRMIRGVFVAQAMGALFDNGVAWGLPVTASSLATLGATITRQIDGNAPQIVQTVEGEQNLVVKIADNVRTELFANSAQHVNTREDRSVVNPSRVVITITFSNGGPTLNTSDAPFDVFLFRSNEYAHQIHRPQFSGTTRMRQDLFGSLQDGSTASRKFVNTRGVPFVLDVPVTAPFPKENARVENLFPRIVDFAASGGNSATDFFSNGVQTGFAFSRGANNQSLPSLPVVPDAGASDQSCVNRVGSSSSNAGLSCLDILNNGGSNGNGFYFIDADGAGGQAPISAFCDMTSDGGGWTQVWIGDNEYTSTSVEVSRYIPGTQNVVNNSVETMFAYMSASNQVSNAWKFPTLTEWKNGAGTPLNAQQCGANTVAATRISDGVTTTDTLVWGSGSFGARCDQACSGTWGRICLRKTGSFGESDFPFYAGFMVSHSEGDTCTTSSSSDYRSDGRCIINGRRFSIFVRETVRTGTTGLSCLDILQRGLSRGNGVYRIDPDGIGPTVSFNTYCDMTTDGGGWSLVAYAGDRNFGFPAMDVDTGSFSPANRLGKASKGAVSLVRSSTEMLLAYGAAGNLSAGLNGYTDAVAVRIPTPSIVDFRPVSGNGTCVSVTARRILPVGSTASCVGDSTVASSRTAISTANCNPQNTTHVAGLFDRSLGSNYVGDGVFSYGLFQRTTATFPHPDCGTWQNISHHWPVNSASNAWQPSATQVFPGTVAGSTSIWLR